MFCNIWVTMLGYSLAVRDREDIALRAFYKLIPPRAGFLLDMFWTAMVFAFGVYLAWFGWVAAMNVPGMFWELGGLKKMYPMLVMPIAGVLVAMAAAGADARRHPDPRRQTSRARPRRDGSGSDLGALSSRQQIEEARERGGKRVAEAVLEEMREQQRCETCRLSIRLRFEEH